MFNSTVLEVAIGLVFCYASVALIASSVYEAIASWFNLRSSILFAGVASLLNANVKTPLKADVNIAAVAHKNSPELTHKSSPALTHNTSDGVSGNVLLQKIYNDALVHPAGDGAALSFTNTACLPAYIPSKNFALALTHAIQQTPGNFENLISDIHAIKDVQLRNLLLSLLHKAAGDVDVFQHELADWFDASMGRLSGIYKKRSQLWCFCIALIIAMVFNIDSVHLFKTLWLQPTLVAQVNFDKLNPVLAANAYQQLQILPIGWNQSFAWSALLSPSLWLGWLLTASASLFGAPFWFDTLKTLVRLRGTGSKPSSEKAARDAQVK